MSVKFEDYSAKISDKMTDSVVAFLSEIGGEIQGRATRESRKDTGQLRSSWEYKVDESDQKVTIGSPLQNAIWEEFGTGQYAVEGDGRKTPWTYVDRNGHAYRTKGKKPNRTLEKSINYMRPKIEKQLASKLKELDG